MDETQMMHGADWQGEDLAGWYLSEKLNGCRAYWDGAQLWTRGGNAIAIPTSWANGLPRVELDCELWAGRDGFERARLACQYGRFTSAVRLMVFDAPRDGRFLDRQFVAHQAIAGLPFAKAVRHTRCASTIDAVRMMHHVMQRGGEGIIARRPDNHYRAGRTREILKLKGIEQ